jgi:hypothetical protein
MTVMFIILLKTRKGKNAPCRAGRYVLAHGRFDLDILVRTPLYFAFYHDLKIISKSHENKSYIHMNFSTINKNKLKPQLKNNIEIKYRANIILRHWSHYFRCFDITGKTDR